MPIRDEELEQSLRTAAPHVSTEDVFERVVRKRSRRRAVRRIEGGAIAFVLVAALSMADLLAQEDDDTSRVAAPGGASRARVIRGGATVTAQAGVARTPVPVTLDPDEGYLRGPLLVSGSTLSLAAYDHDGEGFTYPPSRILQLDTRTFRQEGPINLKAEILSVANGDGGARWVVTRNPPPKPAGLPDAFLKRIGADGTVVSMLLPPGTDVIGPVVAGAGAVWVPVRDGVLRYDPAIDRVVGRVDLAPADSRSVVIVDSSAWATDGSLLRRLVPADGAVNSVSLAGPNEELVGVAPDDGQSIWAVLRDTVTGETRYDHHDLLGANSLPAYGLPGGFTPTRVMAADGRAWVEGTAGGSPAVVLLGGNHNVSTVVLNRGRDASFAWVSADAVLAVSNGTLLRISVKS